MKSNSTEIKHLLQVLLLIMHIVHTVYSHEHVIQYNVAHCLQCVVCYLNLKKLNHLPLAVFSIRFIRFSERRMCVKST